MKQRALQPQPTRHAVHLEHWTWRALPGLALGAYVSPRRANKLCRDLGWVEDYVPPLPGHPRLSRTFVAFCQVGMAPFTLPMYPLLLGYMAIVYAIERRRARASIRAAELRAMRDAEAATWRRTQSGARDAARGREAPSDPLATGRRDEGDEDYILANAPEYVESMREADEALKPGEPGKPLADVIAELEREDHE
jgi:hypothetical protein